MQPSIIILTFNSALSLRATLEAAAALSDDLHIVDSGSVDSTLAIAKEFGAQLHSHEFCSYGEQRNWAIDTLVCRYPWQLHLDADEVISKELVKEVHGLALENDVDGYFIKRYLCFMGRLLKHNLAPTWHMRLFRSGRGRCEARHYDQHFYCLGGTRKLNGSMVDDVRMSLGEWTNRHNRWADAEVKEILSRSTEGRLTPKLTGNVTERKRYFKGFYERAPLLARAFALFVYRYVLRGGWLDGKEGLIFCTLQTLWFRTLVDAKLMEARRGLQESRARS